MINFAELPADGIRFEQLVRELLVLEGFETHWTGVGADGGRDLVITEQLKGELSSYSRKWLISCKHNANSGKSVGRDEETNIVDNCKAVKADGYILVCSTQTTAAMVTRLQEIEQQQQIITRVWDAIELEKRLLKPHTFGLIHTFFPESSKNYQWKIYNAFSPGFWAANYKDHFFYLSCRLSNTYPGLPGIETLVQVMEQIELTGHKSPYGSNQHLRLRAVYYDDKHSTHLAFVDYIYPNTTKEQEIISPGMLKKKLFDSYRRTPHDHINMPDWDIVYRAASTGSDHFDLDHKQYYEPHMKNFESGTTRNGSGHNTNFRPEGFRQGRFESSEEIDDLPF